MSNQNLGWNTLEANKKTNDQTAVTVDFIRLDEVDPNLLPKKIKLIKIDVEGAEFRIINGGKQFFKDLPNPKPIIMVEVAWADGSHPSWDEEIKAFDYLFENGWKRTAIKNPNGGTWVCL